MTGTTAKNQSANAKSAHEFYSIVRSEFAYLEADDGPNPDFTIMETFYESISRRSYPFWRGCGYWNVFVTLDIVWDCYDDLFTMTLARRKHTSEVDTSGAIHLGEILAVVDTKWPSNWKKFDANDGPAQVKVYAKAARNFAREIFIPSDREAVGFGGFSWYTAVMDRRSAGA